MQYKEFDMNKYLLYYYTDNYKKRWYIYIYAQNIDEAWKKAEQLYEKENLEVMSGKDYKRTALQNTI